MDLRYSAAAEVLDDLVSTPPQELLKQIVCRCDVLRKEINDIATTLMAKSGINFERVDRMSEETVHLLFELRKNKDKQADDATKATIEAFQRLADSHRMLLLQFKVSLLSASDKLLDDVLLMLRLERVLLAGGGIGKPSRLDAGETIIVAIFHLSGLVHEMHLFVTFAAVAGELMKLAHRHVTLEKSLKQISSLLKFLSTLQFIERRMGDVHKLHDNRSVEIDKINKFINELGDAHAEIMRNARAVLHH